LHICLCLAEAERDNDEHVVQKLNKALQHRINKINEQKEVELAEKKKREKEQETKKNKKPKFKDTVDDIQTASRMKKKEKSLVDRERALHESYQLILVEHRRRMKKRTKDNFKSVGVVKAKAGAVAAFQMSLESKTDNVKDNTMKRAAGNNL